MNETFTILLILGLIGLLIKTMFDRHKIEIKHNRLLGKYHTELDKNIRTDNELEYYSTINDIKVLKPNHEVVIGHLNTYDCGWTSLTTWWNEQDNCWMTTGSVTSERSHLKFTHWSPIVEYKFDNENQTFEHHG